MLRTITIIVLSMSLVFGAIQSNMYYRGEMNGWGSSAMTFRDLGTDSWLITIQSDGTDGSSEFKFANTTDWSSTDWSSGGVTSLNSYVTWYDPNGGNGNFSETDPKYYTFIVSDVANENNANGFILETSATPIAISSVSDNSGDGVPNTNVTVSITLSGGKSAEENVYVRYSTDGWVTDNWSLATGSGTSYTATISTSGSGTVSYYALTTTLTSSGSGDLDNYPDLATISADANSGSNYSFAYDQSLPVELSSFSASNSKAGVTLSWSTDSEIENQGFIISRKISGAWNEIASFVGDKSLNGQGSTTKQTHYSFTDPQVREGIKYSYMLSDVDYQGERTDHEDRTVQITFVLPESEVKPGALNLTSLYPNPFNPSISVSYDLMETANVLMEVYDVQGQLVWQVRKVEQRPAQDLKLHWNGRDLHDNAVSSGVYLISLEAGNQRITQKATLLR